ncbi:MAG TPA: hypothetical protein VJL08_01270, partial [Dehalococcoidia bacterium]|nr:hypothetical protein [Dehalococcoidia bacterium]
MLKYLRKIRLEHIVGAVSITITVAIAVAIVRNLDVVRSLAGYGYAGVLVVSILAGGTIVVPIPGLAVVFS